MKFKLFIRQSLALFLAILFSFSSMVNARPLIKKPFDDDKQTKIKLPPVNWIRSRTIDVKHILIDLKFDWEKEQAYGTSTITVAPFNDTNKIYLDAAYMTISAVTLANGAALKYDYKGKDSDNNLEITLDRVYKNGEDVTVKVTYRTNYVNTADADTAIGSFGRGLRFIKPTADNPNKPYQIWSQGETEFNRYWFPSYDSPNDFRTTELKATVDKKYTVVSNGKLIDKKDNGDGSVTFDWKMDIPYSNYLSSIVVAEYAEVKSGEYAGIPIIAYGYKNETKEVYETTKSVPDMVKFFSEKTGVKYAYPKYSQAMVEEFGGGMENISATTQIEEMIVNEKEMVDGDSNSLQAHELAHQWFGDYVTCRDWGQIWLNESFATYFDALYNEHSKGHEDFLYNNIRSNQNTYYGDWAQGIRRPIVTKYYANKDAMFDNYAYPRGADVLHMLRKHLGEENWWKAINHYLTSNAHKPVSTENLRIAIEEATGESMDWFFDQWLYKMGHPVFEVSKNYSNGKLTLTVKQTQKIDPNNEFPQAEFFQGKMDIEVDGKIEQIWIKPQTENVYSFDVAAEPKLVNFDFESTWLKEVKFNKSVDELIYQMTNDKDVLARRSAGAELAATYKKAETSATDKDKIMSTLRNVAANDKFWRVRRGILSEIGIIFTPQGQNQANVAVKFDDATAAAFLKATKDESSQARADAIAFLGNTRDVKYENVYLEGLNDKSNRVNGESALALAKTKSPKAFDALVKMVNTDSWHQNSRIQGLQGLAELGDKRALDLGLKYANDKNQPAQVRTNALGIIGSIGKGDPRAYPLIFENFKKALDANNFNSIFTLTRAFISLADPRGQEAFDLLKNKFKDNPNIIGFVNQLEGQFKEAIKK
ncbi:MAG: HEAT repeat domain-containing protein [Pyrinomonadaceae bacterium]|nr:HEAT repeat domain-containing protein [Pyrinomonadaceae bacterium]